MAHQQEIIHQQQQLSQQMHNQHEKELLIKEQEFREKIEKQQKENDEKFRELQDTLSQNHSDQMSQFFELNNFTDFSAFCLSIPSNRQLRRTKIA